MTWPSNPSITFTQPVFDEKEPHYDNYEEFYRPYIFIHPATKEKLIRYLRTSPIHADTDGDCLLDPDDPYPLSYPHPHEEKPDPPERTINNNQNDGSNNFIEIELMTGNDSQFDHINNSMFNFHNFDIENDGINSNLSKL